MCTWFMSDKESVAFLFLNRSDYSSFLFQFSAFISVECKMLMSFALG